MATHGTGTAPALVFDPRPRRLAAGGLARTVAPWAVLRAGGPLHLEDLPPPRPPGPDWVLLRSLRTGICGSDLAQVGMQADFDNPLTAILSFPHVMGHEIVAQPLDAEAGDNGALVVDPWMGCEVRNIDPPCTWCAAGHPALCVHAGEAATGHGQGMHLGNIAGLPGGFGTVLTAHRVRTHPLPPGLSHALGVLADPLAVGGHALDRAGLDTVDAGGSVLVIGAGTIGLSVVATLRCRRPDLEVLVTARWQHLADAVRRLGATPVAAVHEAVVDAVRRRCGGTLRRPWRGGGWLSGGGAPLIIDAVAQPKTLETALRVVAARGRIVSVGVARPRRTESTLLYYKEAEVAGSNGYGSAGIPDAIAMIDAAPERFAPWLTHTRTLRGWREAFEMAMRPGRTGAIKVTIAQDTDGERQ
jgi:threonine dehydrogenase-like Zn-dependent dehydrogenase